MLELLSATISQCIPFLPLALAIYISFNLMKAIDMTLDGSFVAGAGVFAKFVTLGYSPIVSSLFAMIAGVLTGSAVATIQRKQKIDPLMAGVLATFILASANLIFMGRPNIELITQTTLLSAAFAKSNFIGMLVSAAYCGVLCCIVLLILRSPLGLKLRAFGDNPKLLARYGKPIELYRIGGFAMTNCLAASAGCLTAQTVGYADIGMGFGVTLTGLGAIILGQQFIMQTLKRRYIRATLEFTACLIGVFVYFSAINGLLRIGVDPMYLKIILGFVLIVFLRAASHYQKNNGVLA